MVPRHVSLLMRLCRPVLAAALLASASPCLAESFAPIAVKNPLGQQTAFIDLLALMSGHCKTLKVAGRTFACKTVAYAHGGQRPGQFRGRSR
ncbi:hypothetical protein ACVWWR_002452 [Bradyrhizobium sp. LM3.2]